METVVIDVDALPDTDGKGQWSNLHPQVRALLKADAFPKVLRAVRRAKVDVIETPCMVSVEIYFKGKSKGGGLDFDNLAICVGKLFLDPLCPDKHQVTKNGIRHRVGLNLIPDDTIDHIIGMDIVRHPQSDRDHTVLTFCDPGQRLKDRMAVAAEKQRERLEARKNKKGKGEV